MQILLASLGSLGDLLPVLSIGEALKQAGHSVSVITTGNFVTDVEQAGLEYIELADAATFEAVRTQIDPAIPRKAKSDTELAAREIMESVPERLYRLVEQHYVPGETVLATLPWFNFGAAGLIREKLDVPVAYLWINVFDFKLVQPWFPPILRGLDEPLKNLLARIFMGPMRSRLKALREDIELAPRSNFIRSWFYSQQLNIALFPNWFVPWFRGQLPNTVFTGFTLYRRHSTPALPVEAEAFLAMGEPPVIFSTASWRSRPDAYLNESLSICRALGLRAVLISDRAEKLPLDDPSVITMPFADFTALLPRARAIVHDGGIGTAAWAMASGIPQLVVPSAYDHFVNGATLKRLRIGDSVNADRYARRGQRALQKLLESPDVAQSCATIARRFGTSPEFGEAIRRLEGLLAGQAGSVASTARSP